MANKYGGEYARKLETGQICKSEKRSVLCKCPHCRKDHRLMIYWTGKGKPWKYCTECLKIDAIQAGDPYFKKPTFRRLWRPE